MRTRVDHVRDLLALAGGAMRVQTRSDHSAGKAAGNWFTIDSPDRHYHLRSVLPCEIGIDLGDHVDFATAAAWANAFARACQLLEVGTWWLSLSAGRGIHLSIFGYSTFSAIYDHAPDNSQRPFVARLAPAKDEALRAAPPCIRAISRWLSNGKPVPHAGRFAIAAYMHHAGFASGAIADLFVRTPNYNAAKTANQVESIEANHSLPYNCTRMKAEGLCIESIKAPLCGHVRNPVSFLPRLESNSPHAEDGDGAEAVPEPMEANDWRWPVFNHLCEVASMLCGDLDMQADHRLVAPNDESRMFREFGSLKDRDGTDRKLLWHDSRSGRPFIPVPSDRAEAYRLANQWSLGWPSKPVPTDLSHLDLRWLPTGCPRSPDCLRSPRHCKGCPIAEAR